jgi:hypothetical protein
VLVLVALALVSPPSTAFAVEAGHPRAMPSPVPVTGALVVEGTSTCDWCLGR